MELAVAVALLDLHRSVRSVAAEPGCAISRIMELTAAIQALTHTEPASVVYVHSDSAYVINAFVQNWFKGWESRGWKNAKGQPVENQDLWHQMRELVMERRVRWVKVKGHAGDPYNEKADRLAVEAMHGLMAKHARR
jgi:ribonuclease HI